MSVEIQQAFRHLFYPSKVRAEGANVDLAHVAIDVPTASEKPGAGQQQVLRTLRDANKLQSEEDEPEAPSFITARTPLKKGEMRTAALREEYRRDPKLPILLGDDIFLRTLTKGVDAGEWIYRCGELLYGKGDPKPLVKIDEQATISTTAWAVENGLWPRKPKVAPASPGSPGGGWTSGTGGGVGGSSPGTPGSPSGGIADGGAPGSGTGAGPSPSPPPAPDTFTAQGVLKQALTEVWEKARQAKVAQIESLDISVFGNGDGFRLVGAITQISGAEKRLRVEATLETADGSSVTFTFDGLPTDIEAWKQVLEPTIKVARDKDVTVLFTLSWPAGFPLRGDGPEKLADKLAKFSAISGFVEATAHVGGTS